MTRNRSSVHSVVIFLLLVTFGAPMAFGQFGGLKKKLEKIGTVKSPESKPPEAKAPQQPQGPPPVVTSITPSEVPPGWEGQVVLTGSNFTKGMKLRLNCGYQTMKIKNFMVESAERVTFVLRVPLDLEETKCVMAFEVMPAAAAETAPTAQGSPQVFQVTGPSLSVSESSGLARAYKACFLAEGNIPAMQLMQSLAQVMNSGDQDECKLMVSADAMKYENKGKVILDTPVSAVKTVEPVLMMGQPMGAFRIVLASGKMYNFFSSESQSSDNPVWDQIKAKIKK
jgi:hypothetical protein